MAFTDFELTGSQSTVLHSAAPLTTNPLTSSVAGAYCRSMTISADGRASKIYFTTSSYGGAFYNIPDTKVVSGRACLRIGSNSSDYNNNSFITIKDSTSFVGAAYTVPGGYKFGLRGYRIVLVGNNNTILKQTATNYTPATWYSLRMDVFPLGEAGDRIICYKETFPGSGIWESTFLGTTFDTTVAAADPSYSAWGNNSRNGVHTSFSGNGPQPHYVDKINFQVYDAP